uniref:LITAF domain-containing protein n=1 Tax=Mola mola TaxID=94237 RepID=A0A3Q4AJV9_MOLML
GQDSRVYHIHSPFSPPPPPPPFCATPGAGCSTQTQSPLPGICPLNKLPHRSATILFFYISILSPVYAHTLTAPRPKFVSYETQLHRSPALTTCPSCRTQVTTQVTYRVGTYAWLMCLMFVLCGLLLGCCLIPLFVNGFKDACHTCPRCQRILHIHRKTCCE